MPLTLLCTLCFLYQQIGDELPFTRADQRYPQLVRGVDMHALQVWYRPDLALRDPELSNSFSGGTPAKFIPHDGLSWKEREEKYHFTIIGLVPDECFESNVTYSMAPQPIDRHLGSTRQWLGDFVRTGHIVTAETFHFYMSGYAKEMSDPETLGPLACRTIVVLMRNTYGVGWSRGEGEFIRADLVPNPMATFIFHAYIDPEAAQKFIDENLQDEEGIARFKDRFAKIKIERIEKKYEEEMMKPKDEKPKGGR